MDTFSFFGRPDGLGNRMEEIINLEAVCSKINTECEYIWQNKHSARSYDICFKGQNVAIVTENEPRYPVKNRSDFGLTFSQEEMLASARKITPDFSISFQDNLRPVAIHIRATDRIGLNHPHFMKDEKELRGYLLGASDELNKIKPATVYVCSESERYKKLFLGHLAKSIDIVEPACDKQQPPEYVDFFALTLCREIWMVSRFSSFSITAALVGNVPLVTFVDDEEVRSRYMAEFRHRSIVGRNSGSS